MVHKSEWIWPPTVFIDTLKENSWNMDELHWFNLNIHAMISISKQNLSNNFLQHCRFQIIDNWKTPWKKFEQIRNNHLTKI